VHKARLYEIVPVPVVVVAGAVGVEVVAERNVASTSNQAAPVIMLTTTAAVEVDMPKAGAGGQICSSSHGLTDMSA
jgi:hypothetical protein